MGLLALGSPLSWDETKKNADHVRRHGIIQFLNIYHRLKNRQNDILKWGDEVNYTTVCTSKQRFFVQMLWLRSKQSCMTSLEDIDFEKDFQGRCYSVKSFKCGEVSQFCTLRLSNNTSITCQPGDTASDN